MPLITRFFLTLDPFSRYVSAGRSGAGSTWPLLRRWRRCSRDLRGSNLACSPGRSSGGSGGGCRCPGPPCLDSAGDSSHPLIPPTSSFRRCRAAGAPVRTKNRGNVGNYQFLHVPSPEHTHTQGSRTLARRPGWSWWTLGEKGKLLMHLEEGNECHFAPCWGCSCFLPRLSAALSLSCVSPSTSLPLPSAFPAALRSCCSPSFLSHRISHSCLPPSSFVCLMPMGCFWGGCIWPRSWPRQPSSRHRLYWSCWLWGLPSQSY